MAIRLEGNSSRISGNPVSPLEAQKKDIGVASQTLLTVFRLRLQRRLKAISGRLMTFLPGTTFLHINGT